MEKAQEVRTAVILLLSQNLGEKLGKSFQASNAEDTLPIFLESARVILGEFIGGKKAQELLDIILVTHEMRKFDA